MSTIRCPDCGNSINTSTREADAACPKCGCPLPNAPPPVALAKACAECGQDVANRSRYRDRDGNYRCEHCEAERTAGGIALAPRDVTRPPAGPGLQPCQRCGKGYPSALLHPDGEDGLVCPLCLGQKRPEDKALALTLGPVGIVLIAASLFVWIFLWGVVDETARVAALTCVLVGGGWVTFLGRGYAQNAGPRSAGTLRTFSLLVCALYVTVPTLQLVTSFTGDHVAASVWGWGIARLIAVLLLSIVFINLKPTSEEPFRFHIGRAVNLVPAALTLGSFLTFVIAALQTGSSSQEVERFSGPALSSEAVSPSQPVGNLPPHPSPNPGVDKTVQVRPNLPPSPTAPPIETPKPISVPHQVVSFNPYALDETTCRRWASDLEKDASTDPWKVLAANMDAQGFFQRTAQGLCLSDSQSERARSICSDVAGLVAGVGHDLVPHRSVKILSLKLIESHWQVLVRVLVAKGGQDYLRMTIAADASAEPKIVDVETISDGGAIGQIGRFLIIDQVANNDPATWQSFSQVDRAMADNREVVNKIYAKVDTHDLDGITELIRQLPPPLQQDHYLTVLTVKEVIDAGKADFEAAVRRALTKFPGDASVHYIRYQRAFLRKQYDQAISALDHLNQAVGGDPFIDALKGNVYQLESRPLEARQSANAAISKEPTLPLPHWTLLVLALADRDYAELRRQLLILENDLGETVPDFEHDRDFAGFVASPEYQAWRASRRSAVAK